MRADDSVIMAMITQEAKDCIRRSFEKGKVVCLTGAGISAESDIPTFRGKGGLWEKYDPARYASPDGLYGVLRNHPDEFTRFLIDFYSTLLQAKPNRAHFVLSVLERDGILKSVITQNIDNLHQLAGSRMSLNCMGMPSVYVAPIAG